MIGHLCSMHEIQVYTSGHTTPIPFHLLYGWEEELNHMEKYIHLRTGLNFIVFFCK